MDHRIIIEFYAWGEADQVTFILTQPNSNFFFVIYKTRTEFLYRTTTSIILHSRHKWLSFQ